MKKLHDFKWPLRWSRTRTPNIKSSFCCPPNVVRTIAEAHNYVYALSAATLWVHLYAANALETAWPDGARIKLRQETDYPWNGAVKLTIDAAPEQAIALKLRVPGWLREAGVCVNGAIEVAPRPGSYAEVKRIWSAGDVVELRLDFAPTLWEANPLVEETLNQVALRCGPLVYCLESNDLPEGVRLTDVALALGTRTPPTFAAAQERIANSAVVTLSTTATAAAAPRSWGAGELYREAGGGPRRGGLVRAVFCVGQSRRHQMSVWLRCGDQHHRGNRNQKAGKPKGKCLSIVLVRNRSWFSSD